ncbi:MAG TPA: flavodoxin family protein [Eggerthellaceae bacterium]|nr:flavodoxin family protein [Eggerthellaceae bacterium]
MKKVIAINASPRPKWNTAQLVREAAQGAQDAGAEAEIIDLYKLDPFMGCRSCFHCMTEKNFGRCVIKDGLAETLAKIREADGLVLGSPNYFGRPTAGFRALYERLCFQHLTYNPQKISSNEHPIPVLFIMTSNAPEEMYAANGYDAMIAEHVGTLQNFVGPVQTFICGNTLQTDRYDRFDWPMFDVAAKQQRHQEVFPQELARVRELAAKMFV